MGCEVLIAKFNSQTHIFLWVKSFKIFNLVGSENALKSLASALNLFEDMLAESASSCCIYSEALSTGQIPEEINLSTASLLNLTAPFSNFSNFCHVKNQIDIFKYFNLHNFYLPRRTQNGQEKSSRSGHF